MFHKYKYMCSRDLEFTLLTLCQFIASNLPSLKQRYSHAQMNICYFHRCTPEKNSKFFSNIKASYLIVFHKFLLFIFCYFCYC